MFICPSRKKILKWFARNGRGPCRRGKSTWNNNSTRFFLSWLFSKLALGDNIIPLSTKVFWWIKPRRPSSYACDSAILLLSQIGVWQGKGTLADGPVDRSDRRASCSGHSCPEFQNPRLALWLDTPTRHWEACSCCVPRPEPWWYGWRGECIWGIHYFFRVLFETFFPWSTISLLN